MKEKIHKGAIYIIDKDEATFDKSILGDTEGRNIIFIKSSKIKGYARKLLDRYFKRREK